MSNSTCQPDAAGNVELFSTHHVGTTDHEIRDLGGDVIAWTVDEAWAVMITSLLNLHQFQEVCNTGKESEA